MRLLLFPATISSVFYTLSLHDALPIYVRYRGQGYELNLPYSPDLLERFHAEHQRRYGYSSPQREVEIVTVRMRGRVASHARSEEHTSELPSRFDLVCRLLLEKKKQAGLTEVITTLSEKKFELWREIIV